MCNVKRFCAFAAAVLAATMAVLAGEGVERQAVAITFATGGVCRTVFAQAGDEVRGGEALVAYAPHAAAEQIASARQALAVVEERFRSARTNALALRYLAEQGAVPAAASDEAESGFRRAAADRQAAFDYLRAAHHELRDRMLFAPGPGRISKVAVAAGDAVEAGDLAVEILPEPRRDDALP